MGAVRVQLRSAATALMTQQAERTGVSKAESPQRGAAAVEFALVVPVLIALLLGIIAFGHAFYVQSVLSNAARDAVRVMALQDTSGGADPVLKAKERAVASASPVVVNQSQVKVTLGSSTSPAAPGTKCVAAGTSGPQNATVTIAHELQLLGGLGTITLAGKGTMRCNG